MSALLVSAALQAASMTGRFKLPDLCQAISLPSTDTQLRDLVWRALAPEATEHVTADGTYWWQIGPDARRGALGGIYALSQLDRFLAQVPPAFKGDATNAPDLFGIALQRILRRDRISFGDPSSTASADELRISLSEAAAYLDAVQFAEAMPVLREERLEVKVWRDGPYKHVTLEEFKALAEAKIKQLQSRCDVRTVLPAHHFGYSTQRETISRFARGVHEDSEPLLLTGVAGVGKSALLSRLILGWQRSQPDMIIVTLDFDRRQLNAGEPIELMQEFLRQVIAVLGLRGRMPDDPLIQGLRRIRSDISLFKTSASSGARETNDQQASDIRSVLRALAADWAQPLREARIVVVMDTFEAIDRIQAYDRLAASQDEDQLPENVVVTQILRLFGDVQQDYLENMRLIISGREEPLTRTGQDRMFGTRLRLRGLSNISGAKLLQAEADTYVDATKAIFEDTEKTSHISSLLDGHPLALIAFVRYADDNREDVDALIADLEKRGGFTAEFAQVFLYRRILERISDRKVRMLAHPGLMLRRLDVDAIEYILAEACLDRGPDSKAPLQQNEAENLFERLRNQYWLVEKVEGRSDMVRHVPDLRRMMLDGLLAGPSDNDKGDRRANKEDLQRRALEVCRLAAKHYAEGDENQKLDATYYGAFNTQVPEDMTKDLAARLDRHLGPDIETMPIAWRARIKFLLDRSLNTQETATLDAQAQQEVLRRGFQKVQKAGFTTKARSKRKRIKPATEEPVATELLADAFDAAEETPEISRDILRGSNAPPESVKQDEKVPLAQHGETFQIAWETGDLPVLFDGIETREDGPVWRLLNAFTKAPEDEQMEFCQAAERDLLHHPIYLAALAVLGKGGSDDFQRDYTADLEVDGSLSETTVPLCLTFLAEILMKGDFNGAARSLLNIAALAHDTSPIIYNRSIGGQVLGALSGTRNSPDELPAIAFDGMSLLAGAPHDEYGRINAKAISPSNFFFGPLEKLYRSAEQEDLSLSMVERVYRTVTMQRFDPKSLDDVGLQMFPKMFRGHTPELYGPLSAILGRLDFLAGEEITLSISSRHPMWPSDLRFDDQFLYSAEQAPSIVETADRCGVLPELIEKLRPHDPAVILLAGIYDLISWLYFDLRPSTPAA